MKNPTENLQCPFCGSSYFFDYPMYLKMKKLDKIPKKIEIDCVFCKGKFIFEPFKKIKKEKVWGN